MSLRELQDYTFVSKYARYNEELKRRETWDEAVTRVQDMHLEKYPQKDVKEDIEWAFSKVKEKRVLGSQRALQFGGKPVLKKNARLYNCLSEETKFISKEGVKSFSDFNDGDEVSVLTHKGNWQKAIVRNHGKQELYPIEITRSKASHTVWATAKHKWILKSGEFQEGVSEGDRLLEAPDILSEFNYDESLPDERLYWAYGMIYGDGTRLQDKDGSPSYSMIRLCGHDRKYTYRFEELGFKTSSSLSLNGDFIAYTGSYLKTTPDPKEDDPRLIRAFIRGYLDADGEKNKNKDSDNLFYTIQASGKEEIEFIRKCFPIAGSYIVSETDYTGQETNFGIRGETTRFRIFNNLGKTATQFKVCDNGDEKKIRYENVWCLEVENDHSFVFPFGLTTGNCTVSFCDRLRFFQESFWLLLCGCGVGFSVQKHHVANLPNFVERKGKTKTYVIPDSIEGWSDSLGVLLNSYFGNGDFEEYAGYDVDFNFSLIRPEGAKLGSSSGKAPGPVPLQNALNKIKELLDDCLLSGRERLRTIDAYDIVMHTSDAVLSGGVRRSATICLFSPDDKDMVAAKTGNWFNENPQRGRSNNSALLIRDKITYEQFAALMESVKEYGEPGFVWSDSTELMVNPCVTKKSLISTTQGLKTVEELIGKKFDALVDGKSYPSNKGFWKTGDKQTLILEFKSGRTLEVTPNHRVMTTNGWKEAKDISLNDEVVINNHREADFDIDVGSKDHAQGYLLGSFLGDGNISKKSAQIKWWGKDKDECRLDGFNLMKKADFISYNYKEESESVAVYSTIESVKLYRLAESLGCVVKNNRRLDYRALSGNWSNLTGLIAGYFDADGTVNVDFKKGCSVRFCSKQMNNLKNLQIALNALGIYGKIYKNRRDAGMRMLPDGKGGSKEFYCEAVHELSISCDNIIRFQKLIPIRNKDKANKINEIVNGYKRLPNRTNFVDVLVNKTIGETQDVYDCTVEDIHAFDCDGIYVHNCVEIGMWPVCAVTGESGWSFCNLCEINGKKVKTEEDFMVAAKAAAIIGTLQAGYDKFDYLGDVTHRIVKREALLGVSITGMMDSPEILFDPKLQRKMAKLVLKVNELIAAKIGVNLCARATCVKPAGTTSCILGTASGIHPHHARRYIRRSQANYLEAPCRHFKGVNPNAVEKSVWSANGTDEVIAFCVEVPKGAKIKNDLDAITLLEHVKSTQQNWVTAGTREEACTQPWLKHNVSNTITVMDNEWDEITNYIFKNRRHFAGISLLPQSGDKDYPQAPFTAIYTPTELARIYGDGMPMASGLVVDGLHEFADNLWVASDEALGVTSLPEPEAPCDSGPVPDHGELFAYEKKHVEWENKKDWCRRVQQFADRYLEGDIRQATYLMKDVHNWKLWCDLKREYKNVDYTLLFEDTDETKVSETIACSGGACDVSYA